MGLDLRSGSLRYAFGSYSYVHVQRHVFSACTIIALIHRAYERGDPDWQVESYVSCLSILDLDLEMSEDWEEALVRLAPALPDLSAQEKSEAARCCIRTLVEILDASDRTISYDCVETLQSHPDTAALVPFVDHSDCDGFLTVGQCVDTVCALRLAHDFASRALEFCAATPDPELGVERGVSDPACDLLRDFCDGTPGLIEFFDAAIASKTPVYFC